MQSTSPLWYDRRVQLVVAIDIWRGTPPKELWSCASLAFDHSELGGVTNGHFKVHIAQSTGLAVEIPSELQPAVRAKFKHVLDPTRPGIRCAIPSAKIAPLGQDENGLLHWTRRLNNVESPTVFSKTHWVKRKLSPKELCAVLDMPGNFIHKTKGFDLSWIEIPGKVRAQVVENIRVGFEKMGGKRRHERSTENAARVKRAKTLWDDPVKTAFFLSQAIVPSQLASDTVTVKSTKDDDASVPTYLWDDRCLKLDPTKVIDKTKWIEALNVLREKFLLPFWKRKVARDFWNWVQARDEKKWWRDDSERRRSVTSGKKAIHYADQASWWEWDGGSYPFFWRWDLEFVREIRDGLAPRFAHNPPACMDRQRPNANPEFATRERSKLFKVLKKGYLRPVTLDETRSLMHYFSVPKGDNDIRMVYDGSKCGLNAATFAPWFAVPTSNSLERTVMVHTVQGDNDYGDMFLNFQLHHEMQKYTGVDATDLLKDPDASRWLAANGVDTAGGVFLTWDRPAMGLTGSPYQSVQTGTRGKRVMLGDPGQSSNPFQWKEVRLNLPGDQNYDPRLPWVFKMREDGRIAADLHTYIDDNRGTANDAEEAWKVSSRVAKTCCWLGMQDAARKRRAPSMTPGAWAGTIIRTDGIKAEKIVSQERWNKTKEKINWIRDFLLASPGKERVRIPHKNLESIRGFLVYVTRTYPEMVPYLKGIHLTLDSWRAGQARSGWKLEVAEQAEVDDEDYDGCWLTNTIDERIQPEELRGVEGRSDPPAFVESIPRLRQDIEALYNLTKSETPPIILIRPVKVMVGYLVGDASGSGHGSSFLYSEEKTLNLAHGTWSEEATQRSSNFRELANLVRRVEQLWKQGKLVRGTELFVFTDNFVTESVFYKGAASSPFLHNLVERLKMVQLHGGLFVHVLWISGTRMIEQGTDGLSRGDFNSGVMAGKDFLAMIPLNRGALDLVPNLEHWIKNCFPGRYQWEVLSPPGWFSRGHEDGHFVWCPPPAVADVALEQMCESVLCRPWNAHVFICPAHMTYKWRKQLRKVSDLVFTVPVGGSLWPRRLHEPLVIGLTFPLLAYSPWRVKRSKRLVGGQCILPKVWSEDWEVERNILFKLWTQEVPSDPDLLWGLAPRVLREKPVGQISGAAGKGLGGLVDGP